MFKRLLSNMHIHAGRCAWKFIIYILATRKFTAFLRLGVWYLLFSTKCHLFLNFVFLCSNNMFFVNHTLKFKYLEDKHSWSLKCMSDDNDLPKQGIFVDIWIFLFKMLYTCCMISNYY